MEGKGGQRTKRNTVVPAGETNVVLNLIGRERGNDTISATTSSYARSSDKGWVAERRVTDSREEKYLRK
jgi:hypothetical protein